MDKKDPKQMTEEEKAKKALLKAQRKAEFEAKFKKEQEKKPKPDNQNKTKSELKAERRAKQEAQRAAKAGQTMVSQPQQQKQQPTVTTTDKQAKQEPTVKSSQPEKSKTPEKAPSKAKVDGRANTKITKQESIISNKELPERMISHLPRRCSDLDSLSIVSLPPEVIKIGYHINKKIIDDPSSRCIAMLFAFYEVVQKYQAQKDMKRELQTILFQDSYNFLSECRPLSISMINAIKHLKLIFSRISSESDDSELRSNVCEAIDTFIKEEILLSRKAISDNSLKLIFSIENQTIMTLGCSSIMKKIFLNAIEQKKKFKVVVVDTRPRFEGRKMVQFLIRHEIPVTYILINSILYVMKEVNKVMFEAHSVLCNGYVMSQIGSSQIALVAQAYNVPVVVCCETYKYSDRAYTDCFIHNELGEDVESFFDSTKKDQIANDIALSSSLNFLDLLYDLTPREFISAVITEKGFLPCTSVPAILRFRETIKF